MTLRRTVSRIVAWWLARRVERTAPELAEIKREIDARRRKHQPTRRLMSIQRALVRARLEAEQGKAPPAERAFR